MSVDKQRIFFRQSQTQGGHVNIAEGNVDVINGSVHIITKGGDEWVIRLDASDNEKLRIKRIDHTSNQVHRNFILNTSNNEISIERP